MANPITRGQFIDCINDAMKARRFKAVRRDEIMNIFKYKAAEYERAGFSPYDASVKAQTDTMGEIGFRAAEKFKATRKALELQAENYARVSQGLTTKSYPWQSRGHAIGDAVKSVIESNPNFKGANFITTYQTNFGKYFSLLNASLADFGKGAFGRQLGKAHLENVVDELHGKATGDQASARFAQSVKKLDTLMVDDFNRAGGSLRARADYGLPQHQSAVKVTRAGRDAWVAHINKLVNWDKMPWEDGRLIDPSERQGVLEAVWNTLRSDGANKIDPTKFQGNGRSLGNMLDKHRFLVFKDGAAWREAHEAYGEGNIFDVISEHVNTMAHKTAMVKMFGRNPQIAFDNLKANARKIAADSGIDKAVTDVDDSAALKRFDLMAKIISHDNPMDPHSLKGNLTLQTSNILVSAYLASIPFLAVPSDFIQTVATRIANNQSKTAGISTYLSGISKDYGFQRDIAGQSGFIFDEVVTASYAAERFTGVATYGNAVTKRISDVVMRSSLINRHTNIARWTVQSEYMGMLNRNRGIAFDRLPDRAVYERYGITAADWDAVRTGVQAFDTGRGAKFLRPIDILQSNIPNKDDLFNKFQSMIHAESRYMVPAASIEAQSMLKGLERPDSWLGVIVHSFSMFKNFPLTMSMMQGRLFNTGNTGTRVAFAATAAVGLIGVGAMGTQLREISKGREPLPMDNPAFWGKAILAGGGLSIMGDFLFNGVSEYGRGATSTAAGPLVGMVSDALNLTLGSGYGWLEAISEGDQWRGNFSMRSLEFLKRNSPGSSLWYARLLLEREVWDRAQEWADPAAARRAQRAKMRRQKKVYGNEYYFPPGDSLFDD